MSAALRVGVDVGGTFTDVVVERADGTLLDAFKLASTPADPAEAVLTALARVSARYGEVVQEVCHGTTVGTNCLIERKGARTALVATRGFRDVIELRRQARPLLFALEQRISSPLVSRELRFELDERVDADGSVLRAPDPAEIERLARALAAAGVEAVAVSFINAHVDAGHELQVAAALRAALPGTFVSTGAELAGEMGEYERTSTAVVNSYIGPRVRGYVERLESALCRDRGPRLFIAKSNGGLGAAATAARFPAHVIESGPAAAVVAAAAAARSLGRAQLIAFDMGGTTAKVGLVRDGTPAMSRELYADRYVGGRDHGGYALRSPVIDLVEIGAGGGSIAWLDHAGVVRIGPRSAGADPGPACYGRGGRHPTFTDAQAALGRLVPAVLAAAGVRLDRALAEQVIGREIARPLGWTVARAADAIVRVAIAGTAELVRLATVRRGIDPRDFALLACGGAAPLVAADVAREVGVPEVLIPPLPGMFSARGTLRAEVRHDLSTSFLKLARDTAAAGLEERFARLEEDARARMATDLPDIAPADLAITRALDVRFEGQLFALTVPVAGARIDPAALASAFREQYRAAYGYDLPGSDVQFVNLRVTVARPSTPPRAARETIAGNLPEDLAHLTLDGEGLPVPQPLIARDRIEPGQVRAGPALVADHGATVVVPAGCSVRQGTDGWLVIEVRP